MDDPQPGRDGKLLKPVAAGVVVDGHAHRCARQARQPIACVDDRHLQSQRERRADARRAVHVERTAHQPGELARDGQTEAGAALAVCDGAVGLYERREQRGLGFRRNADTGVGDPDDEVDRVGGRFHAFGAEAHAAVFGELDGIGQEVGQHLAQAHTVHRHRGRHGCIHVHPYRQRPFMGAACQQADRAVEQCAQVGRRGRDGQAAGLDLCVVEDVVEDVQQRPARLLHQCHHPLLLAFQPGLQQQFHQAEHAVHRGADLVAHRGQEAVLGAQRGFGRLPGRHQRIGLRALCGDVAQVAVPDRASVGSATGTRTDM